MWLAASFYVAVFVIFNGVLGYIVHKLYIVHKDMMAVVKRPRMTFSAYLSYRFEYWFDSHDSASCIVLTILTTGTLILGSLLYLVLTQSDIETSMWLTFVWIVCPDAGAGERTVTGYAVGVFLSICGLVIFALLLTMVQDSFSNWLESHRKGASPIIESGHILLIGLQEHMFPVIQELCNSHKDVGGTTICILSGEYTKEDMEIQIRNTLGDFDMHGSRVLVRSGNGTQETDLKHVAADTAKTIIILPNKDYPKEMRDAGVLRTVIALRGSGWPIKGRLLVNCSLPRNEPLFRETGGTITDIVMFDSFMSKLMVQSSRQCGVGQVISQVFSPEGNRFGIAAVPEFLIGRTVSEASYHYPSAVICGVGQFPSDGADHHSDRSSDTCQICPRGQEGASKTLKRGDYLVLFSDVAEPEVKESPCMPYPEPKEVDERHFAPKRKKENLLIMGFNGMVGKMIRDLDELVEKPSHLVIVSPMSKDERIEELEKADKRSTRARAGNIAHITHIEAALGSRWTLEALEDMVAQEEKKEREKKEKEEEGKPTAFSINGASRIFVVSDHCAPSFKEADTSTIGAVLQIHDSIKLRQTEGQAVPLCPIVPEIRNPTSGKHLQKIRARDFINSSELPSQVIAMTAVNPHLLTVLRDIIGEDGHVDIFIRNITHYADKPAAQISFFEVSSLVSAFGDIALGWSAPLKKAQVTKRKSSDEFRDAMFELVNDNATASIESWELNPKDKCTARDWNIDVDCIVVLHPVFTT